FHLCALVAVEYQSLVRKDVKCVKVELEYQWYFIVIFEWVNNIANIVPFEKISGVREPENI
ncbi:unnamed protein product, partial [Heterotrigona itama]